MILRGKSFMSIRNTTGSFRRHTVITQTKKNFSSPKISNQINMSKRSITTNGEAGVDSAKKLSTEQDKGGTTMDVKKRPGVGVGVFVTSSRHPGSIILGKRKGSSGEGMFALPGGHLEFGESWSECAQREAQEETGLLLKNISYANVVNAFNIPTNYHYVTIFMRGEIDDDYKQEPENLEPEKCEGWDWFRWEDLPAPAKMFLPLKVLVQSGFTLFPEAGS